MNVFKNFPLYLSILTAGIGTSFNVSAQSADPGSGRTILMIGQIYQDEYQDFINQVGLTPFGGSLYGTAYTGGFEQGSGAGFLNFLESNYPGSIVVAAMSFKDNPSGGGYGNVNDGLAAFANGTEDNDINSYINIFRNHPNTTFLLRVGYEVNSLYIGMNANLYIQAYRRIVDRIRAAGVNNVEFVYHPVRNFSDVEAFYPGASYVDWFALSVFNNDVCLGNVTAPQWCNGGSVEVDVARSFDWARGRGHKLLIAESAAQAPVNNTASGFNDYLSRLNSLVNTYDIRGLVYINSDWRNFASDPNFTDSRVQKFTSTQNYWLSNFGANTRYQYHGTSLPNDGNNNGNNNGGNNGNNNGGNNGNNNGGNNGNNNGGNNGNNNGGNNGNNNGGNNGSNNGNSTGGFVFGIEADGTIYHLDGGQTAGFVYLCTNGNCISAQKNGNRWEAESGLTSGSYNLEFKIQDNATGQCIATAANVAVGSGVTQSPCTSAVGSGNSGGSTPDAGNNTPPDAGNNTPPDAGNNTPPDAGNNTPPDAGNNTPPDAGNNTPPDAGNNGGGSNDFVFGLRADGTLYHINGGQTGGFVYICINGACNSASLNNNYWEYQTGITSGTHNLEFKIQDNATGQCIAQANGVAAGSGVSSSPCQ